MKCALRAACIDRAWRCCKAQRKRPLREERASDLVLQSRTHSGACTQVALCQEPLPAVMKLPVVARTVGATRIASLHDQ